MGLQIFWFSVIAVFWTGFFVLEGFDLGVGALHAVVGKTDLERRVAINTIGPFWDGNEVWLIVAGAGTFAAFPDWYATWFSAGYLALMLVLVALIVRGVSFEFRNKIDTHRWKHSWTVILTVASTLAAVAVRHRPRRPPRGTADRQRPRVHRHVLEPAHALRDLGRRHAAQPHPPPRHHVPQPPHHRDRQRAVAPAGSPAGASSAIVAVIVFATWTHVLSDRGDRAGTGAGPRRSSPSSPPVGRSRTATTAGPSRPPPSPSA